MDYMEMSKTGKSRSPKKNMTFEDSKRTKSVVSKSTSKKSTLPTDSKKATSAKSARSEIVRSDKTKSNDKSKNASKDAKSKKANGKTVTFHMSQVKPSPGRSTMMGGTTSVMPSTVMRKQSIFIRMKIVENEEEEKNLIKKCMIIGLVLIVLLVIGITVALIAVYAVPKESKPDSIIPNPIYDSNAPIPNMTDVCQKLLNDPCLYYRYKYVDNCSESLCESLFITPILDGTTNTLKLIFEKSTRSARSIRTPDGTPCRLRNQMNKLTYWCDNGKCQPRIDARLTAFESEVVAVKGSWSNWSSEPKCLENKIQHGEENGVNWTMYTQRASCEAKNLVEVDPCIPFPYVFRSCTNPPPRYGGSLCWTRKKTKMELEWYEWPMKFGTPCNCGKTVPGVCSSSDVNSCQYVQAVKGTAVSDYKPCCDSFEIPRGSESSEFSRNGSCILGWCMTIDPNYINSVK